MITFIHLVIDFAIWIVIGKVGLINTSIDLFLLFSVNLIDLDHLFSKPIFSEKRNPFKTHFIHKQWKLLLILAIVFLFIRPIMFLGIGIMSHFFLDYVNVKLKIYL